LLGAPILQVPSLVQSANPRTYVTTGDPKFLVMHGTADCTVPYQQSQGLVSRLNAVSPGSATLHLFPGVAHGGATWTSATTVSVVTTFFKNTL
jgi:dipeptidyl aminopeptidase/acylaminoacyl peptidase